MCVLAYERGAYTLAFLKAGFKMNNIPEAKWVLPMLQEVKCDKKHYHVVMEWLRKQPKGHRHLALGIDRLRLNDDKLSYETCVPA